MIACSRSAFTLLELMIATTIAMIVILGVTSMDITRVRMGEEIRDRSGMLPPEHLRTAMAVLHIAKRLEQADRIFMVSDGIPGAPMGNGVATQIQIRVPEFDTDVGSCTSCTTLTPGPCCFDIQENYRWDEYRFVDADSDGTLDTIRYFSNTIGGAPCPNYLDLAAEIQSFQFWFRDTAVAPPGGEVWAGTLNDNNVLEYSIFWNNGIRSHEFLGEVALRSMAYTDLFAVCGGGVGPCDSGRGMALPLVDDTPPGPC